MLGVRAAVACVPLHRSNEAEQRGGTHECCCCACPPLVAQMAPGVVAVCKRFRAFPCTATPAPGAAHGPLWQAQRLRLRRGKEEQRAASRAAALSAGAAAAGPDAAAAASAATDSAQGAAAAVAGQGAAFAATEASGDGGGGEGAAGRSDGVVTAGAGSAAAEEEDWDLLSLTCEVCGLGRQASAPGRAATPCGCASSGFRFAGASTHARLAFIFVQGSPRKAQGGAWSWTARWPRGALAACRWTWWRRAAAFGSR